MSGPWEKYGGASAAPAAPSNAPRGIPGTGPKPPAPPTPLQLRDQELQEAAARREEIKFNAEYNPDGTKKPGAGGGETAGERKADMQNANLDSLVQQINRVQELFNKGQRDNVVPLLGSLWEYLPTQDNKAFDSAGAGLAEQGLAAFRVPGVGAQSDAELRQFVEANKPDSWSMDSQNTERLRQLRQRVDATREALGLPPAQWTGLDASAPATGTGSFQSKGRTITFDIPVDATDQQIAEIASKAAREAGAKIPASQFNVPQNTTRGWGKAKVVN